ncbi:MAG TPA: Holliday junction branch migration protein RuvA [Bacillota bacterium]|jgi:Holliday junction DNA helicase RuvA|nr:Holliday junction branch migration protein RuvA [Bacillota bacterium]HQE66554.1 Holliday junction branch migration protein RuvA [Bacillota bacterium]HQI16026.1 Holliday junction branch migration protein RuvA [Bacillota bacterium]HQJ36971.1 Holliday junction branch migration protein RuvA [Bacillota bacterium]HQL36816.1 Holliday junction branch migration protein RuvA [Bacillota bacterium]
MYEYISGRVDYIGEDYAVIDISGLGYRVFTSQNSMKSLKLGEISKIFTHLIVKEDDLVLYGFATRDELGMFKLLISVSGVGPKAAASLLNQYKASELAAAILGRDIAKLSKAQGIGKKISERIILELKDKIDTESAVGGIEVFGGSDEISQVIEALTALGYNYSIAANAVMKLKDKNKPIDILIKEALRQLGTMK